MAGTVTTTEKVLGTVKKITFTWTASAGGAADATTDEVYDGKLIGLTTDPGAGTAPTDNYDVVITDADGHDVLLGAGADRDTATTEHVAEASLGAVAHSPLTLAVTNAGAGGEGVVIVYLR
jgi:hypothetical protein